MRRLYDRSPVATHLWHPFTQMKGWADERAPVIAEAEGPWLIDTEGRRYIDGVSSLWCNVHGHRHPRLDDAVRKQLEKVAHTTLLGLSHPPAEDLASRLVALAPTAPGARPLTRVFYSDSGSAAYASLALSGDRAILLGAIHVGPDMDVTTAWAGPASVFEP